MDRMVFGCPRGTWSSCHPVILSELSRDDPILDPGFRVVERQGQRQEPAADDVPFVSMRIGWLLFAGPSG